MARKAAGPRIATANRLRDGLVVFLRADGDWTLEMNEARVAHGDEEATALESAAQKGEAGNHVVGVYLVEVEPMNGRALIPVENRERLRNFGPTAGNSLDTRAAAIQTRAA